MTKPAARRQIKVRVEPELSVEVKRYCAAHGITETALMQAALKEYLTNTSPYEVLVRRLDRISLQVEQARHAVQMLTEAFASFVRLWLAHTPEVPSHDAASVWREALPRYRRFVDHVAKRLHSDDGLYLSLARAAGAAGENTHD
jgi:hypothetical protein